MIQHTTILQKILIAACVAGTALTGCSNSNFIKKNSPNNAYKDYTYENKDNASILGVGEPMSMRQMKADATFSMKGVYNLEAVMKQMASTYNVAIRWGDGARKLQRHDVLINKLSFDELRAYVEDVYDVQIIREGERRLLVLPSTSEPRLETFNPGDGVALGTALRGLAEQCGYNLVINDNQASMSQKISTNLKNVTCIDAFEALLTPVDLSIVKKGDYYTLGGLPQRQWTVNLYEPMRQEQVEVNYSSDITGASSSAESSGGSNSTAGGKTSVKVTYDRDLWKDLENDLDEMIKTQCTLASRSTNTIATASSGTPALLPPPVLATPSTSVVPAMVSASTTTTPAVAASTTPPAGSCGYVKINRSVGLIQMRAAQSVLEEADDVIARVEEVATRRLMLEARVLAVSRNRNYDQNGHLRGERGDQLFGYNNRATTMGAGSALNTTESGASLASSLAAFLDGSGGSGTAGNAGTGAGGFFGVSNATLQAAVQFLESYGTTYELMHPRIELMDRQRATLIDGRNEKYFIITRTEQDPNNSNGDVIETAEEKSQFLGLQFSVAAQVGDVGEPHTISLQLPITSLARMVTTPGTTPSEVPIATTRLIDQQVRLRDGEIKVIGGLTRTIAVDRESGIPLFRDIPVAGKLGNEENIAYENVEFVVLLQVRREE